MKWTWNKATVAALGVVVMALIALIAKATDMDVSIKDGIAALAGALLALFKSGVGGTKDDHEAPDDTEDPGMSAGGTQRSRVELGHRISGVPVLITAILLAFAVFVVGCAGVQRCPTGDSVLVEVDNPGSYGIAAWCESDEDYETRVELHGSQRTDLRFICPPGTIIGPDVRTWEKKPCSGQTCNRASVTCVPLPPNDVEEPEA